MKAYILVFLFGLIASKLCALYTHERVKGKYNSGGIFSSPSCTCIHGLVGLVDKDMKACYCYTLSMISECKADKHCKFDNYVGCYN